MALELLQSLSLPGDPAKANEDAFGNDAHAAVILDGATPLGDPLMPGNSDAKGHHVLGCEASSALRTATYQIRFSMACQTTWTRSLSQASAAAFHTISSSCPATRGQHPPISSEGK